MRWHRCLICQTQSRNLVLVEQTPTVSTTASSQYASLFTIRQAAWYMLVASVCLSICLSVCNTITFESIDLESSPCTSRYIFRGYKSRSYMKEVEVKVDHVITPSPGLSESITAAAVMASPFQPFRVWLYLPAGGRLKTRDRKTRDWKTRHQTAGVENAGVTQYGKPKSPLFNIVTSVLQQPLELMWTRRTLRIGIFLLYN